MSPITRGQAAKDLHLRKTVNEFDPFRARSSLVHTPPPSVIDKTPSTSSSGTDNFEDTVEQTNDLLADILPLDEMAVANNSISISDALKIIPDFNGRNIPLTEFIDACKEAREMVGAAQERNLLRFIKTRIHGEALSVVKTDKSATIDALQNCLKNVFCSPKTAYDLIGQLTNEYQRDNERVIGFANRIRDIAKKIIDIKRLNGEVPEDIKTFIENHLADTFKNGLRPEIEQRLSDSDDLSDIIKSAVEIEYRLEAQRNRRKTRQFPDKKNLLTCQFCHCDDHDSDDCPRSEFCNYCKRNGHKITSCPRKERRNAQLQSCQLCGKTGHLAPQCFKMAKCQNCGKMGHTASLCRTKAETCQICSKPGHTAINCLKVKAQREAKPPANPVLPTPNSTSKVEPTCHYCKAPGHFIKDCIKREYANRQKNDLSLQVKRATEETCPAEERSLNSTDLLAELVPL